MDKSRRAQLSGDEIFECLPGKRGLIVNSSDGFLSLPDGEEDRVLDQPALPMGLTREELAELCHPERPVAITHFGPASQDKESNQDFALSALIHDSESRPWRFAAVADGVSGKTFWPERSSRIACLSAYRFFRGWISDSKADADQSRESLREGLVNGLVSRLRDDLREDKVAMGARENYAPSTCSRQHYRTFQSRPDLWYNSTLLVAALGPRYGVVLWAGDGGLWVRKEGQEPKTHLSTGSGMVIDHFVSLDVQPGDFKAGLIHCDRHRSVSVALARSCLLAFGGTVAYT